MKPPIKLISRAVRTGIKSPTARTCAAIMTVFVAAVTTLCPREIVGPVVFVGFSVSPMLWTAWDGLHLLNRP